MPEVQLRVDSAYPGDQGGGKARLDPETMLLLKISPGDLVAIEGRRRTVSKVWRALVEDWNQRKIRIDNFTRMNAGVSIGDTVKVVKIVDEVEAKRVVLAPPEDLPKKIPIANNPHVLNGLIDFPVAKNDSVPIMLGLPFIQPQIVAFKVVEIEPEEAVIITKNTSIEFSDKPAAGFEGIKRFSYEDIGGLKDELQRLRETIELPLRHPELFQKLGIDPPKGVLLYGPPGTGKTLIAKAVASESGAHFISIAGPEVISKYYGESEQRLREVFEEARENSPSIIFIDELDSIAPRREEVTGEVERRVVAQLLTMMDGLEERGQVVVIGATNRVDAIDAALRRPGRFDREIEIGVPSELDRIEILKIHTRNMPFAEDKIPTQPASQILGEIDLDNKAIEEKTKDKYLAILAKQTHGFVGADLAALAREAAIRALRRYLPELSGYLEIDEIPEDVLDKLKVFPSDFRSAQRDVGPSAMREVMLEVSHVKWENVGGLEDVKKEVREAVEYPLTKRQKLEDLGIEPPRGVLLYGPPGTGKTLIAKAIASESGANFIPVRGPQLLSKWVGESERAVREVFKKARQVAPSIIFFDEIDALAPARGSSSDSHVTDNVLNQILTEMDGLVELKDVVIMGATNRPDIVDPALLRAGRFDRLVYIGEASLEDRIGILNVHAKYLPIEGTSIEDVIELTKPLNEDEIEKLIGLLRKDHLVSADYIKTVFRESRHKSIEDLLKNKKLKLGDISLSELVEITLNIENSIIEKVITSLWKEQSITQEDIKSIVSEIKNLGETGILSMNPEEWIEKIQNKQKNVSLAISQIGLEFLIDIAGGIFEESSLDETIEVLAKWQSITLEDIETILKDTISKDKIREINPTRMRKINVLIHSRKIIIKDLTPEKFIEITDILSDENFDKLIESIKEQISTRSAILATINEIRESKLIDYRNKRKIKFEGFTDNGLIETTKLSDSDLENLLDKIWVQQAVREIRRRKVVPFLESHKLKLQDIDTLDIVDITLKNKIEDNRIEAFIDMLWKEQPIKEEEIIDNIRGMKQEQESIRRSTRRRKIFEDLDRRKLELDDPRKRKIIADLALKTEGYVGSDLELVCREAGMLALREGALYINQSHFEGALNKVHPTMNERLRESYQRIQQHFKGGLPKQVQPPEYQ